MMKIRTVVRLDSRTKRKEARVGAVPEAGFRKCPVGPVGGWLNGMPVRNVTKI